CSFSFAPVPFMQNPCCSPPPSPVVLPTRARIAMSVLVYEWRSLKPDSQQHILKLRDIYEQLWLDALAEARAAGMVAIEPFILRRFLTGALSWTTNWYKPDGDMTLDELAEYALTLAIKQ
ncbi:MAG: hypothetical protein KKH95_02395, partial [Gammaproteobacteria bacterium]|nr:hypothetical protein [Gammaproteobacteria bacterium]